MSEPILEHEEPTPCPTCGRTRTDDVRAMVDDRIRAHLVDKDLVEVQLTEAVADRLLKWAKVFGSFAAVPAAILLAILVVLDVQNYNELKTKIDGAEKDVTTQAQSAIFAIGDSRRTVNALNAQSAVIANQYAKLQQDLAAYAQIKSAVTTLNQRVTNIERGALKTGADPEATRIDIAHPSMTTIANLRALVVPQVSVGARKEPYETHVWTVRARLTAFKHEMDGDYHLVLTDGAATMVAEIPDPALIPDSPFQSQIAAARAAFERRFAVHRSLSMQHADAPVTVTGIGFFDVVHGQSGMAPNGAELHPVLTITFN
jgi:hypothetical protein